MIIKDIISVVRAGNALKNPEKWKRGHWLVSSVSLLVTGCMGIIQWKFPNVVLDQETQSAVAQGICYMLVAINMYLIPATTEKPLTKKAKKPIEPWVNPDQEAK